MRLLHSYNYHSHKLTDKQTPLTYGCFQDVYQIAIGDRVEYLDIGCWNFFGKGKNYKGFVKGMNKDDNYLVELDTGETIQVNRNRLKVIPFINQEN